MIRNLLVCTAFMLLALCLNVSAQQQGGVKRFSVGTQFKTENVKTSEFPVEKGEYWWSYCDNDKEYQQIGMGAGQKMPYDYGCAICIPAETKDLQKRIIEGVSFAFKDVKYISDVKVWVSKELPASPEEATEFCQNVNKVVALSNLNYVRFDKPYTVNSETKIYVGYSFKVKNDKDYNHQYPVLVKGIKTVEGGLLMKTGKEDWFDYKGMGYGNLAMNLLLSRQLEENAMKFTADLSNLTGAKGQKMPIPVTIENAGSNAINDFDVTVEISGAAKQMHIVLEKPVAEVTDKYSCNLEVDVPDVFGNAPIKITVDKVNGKKNAIDVEPMEGTIFILSRVVKHKVVFEEFTGIWCPNCPRGIVGTERARINYGDDIVIITVHDDRDPLYCPEYQTILTGVPFPSAHIDRTYFKLDPYFGNTLNNGNEPFAIHHQIDELAAQAPVAEVNAFGELDGMKFTAKADVRFLYDGKANHSVAFVLTEDSVKNEKWAQKNNLRGKNSYLEMDPLFETWVNGSGAVKGVVYNDVAIIAKGVKSGIWGSVPENVKAEEPVVYEETFDLSQLKTIQDVNKLKVCVLLFDNETGRIINADCTPMSEILSVEGVETSDEDSVEVARYTIDGRKIFTAEKGINIVKYSDGTVKKVVVR